METTKTLKKELVYVYPDNKDVFAERQSNQTLLIKNNKVRDTDQSILTDKKGHRYIRQIRLETYINVDYFIYFII